VALPVPVSAELPQELRCDVGPGNQFQGGLAMVGPDTTARWHTLQRREGGKGWEGGGRGRGRVGEGERGERERERDFQELRCDVGPGNQFQGSLATGARMPLHDGTPCSAGGVGRGRGGKGGEGEGERERGLAMGGPDAAARWRTLQRREVGEERGVGRGRGGEGGGEEGERGSFRSCVVMWALANSFRGALSRGP